MTIEGGDASGMRVLYPTFPFRRVFAHSSVPTMHGIDWRSDIQRTSEALPYYCISFFIENSTNFSVVISRIGEGHEKRMDKSPQLGFGGFVIVQTVDGDVEKE